MGTGTSGWERVSDQTRLGQRKFTRLMRHGAERGAEFIDTADLYGAHSYVKAALAEMRREDITLLSKIWFSKAPKMDPWVDVIFARINPGHKRMDEDATVEQVAETLRLARANGKGVVGMKIYGSGQWQSPEQRRQSLDLALNHGLTDVISIGHLTPAQFDDTVANMEAVLTDQS